MKRLASLLLLPLASGALFAQAQYSITPSTLPDGVLNVPYSPQTLSVYPPSQATWSIIRGSLPSGLTWGPTSGTSMTISGTPNVAGAFFFTIQASIGTILAAQPYAVVIALPPVFISPSTLPGGTLYSTYSQVLTASGGYGSGTYTFSLDPTSAGPLPPGLGIVTSGPTTGTVYGTPVTLGTFPFTVRVTSQPANGTASFGSQSYSITIGAPPLAITSTSLPNGAVGVFYSQAVTATGGSQPYTWRLTGGSLPGGLSLDSFGDIDGTPTAVGSFQFQVWVSDSLQASASGSFTIRITAAPLVITTSLLPAGTVGSAYTASVIATGGAPPYTWSVASGATLPNGLSISSAGVISGTPTAAGTSTVILQVTDSAQGNVTRSYSLTVIAAALKITTAPPLADGVVGVSYTQQFAASGGVAPYVWSTASGSIPSGLSLGTATGLLSGTPDTPGTYNFTIGVTDQNSQKDSAAFSIKIVAPLSITTQTPLPGGVVGVSYTQTFAATGGTSPYQWSVFTGAALPAGLTLSASTGSLTGTPTAAGTFNFTLQVADSAARTATKAFTITVTGALTIVTATLPNGTVGTPYSQTPTPTGGTAPFTWSVSTGALPTGLTLSATGSLAGTPTAAGTFNFTLQVADSARATATQAFTITVTAALTITTATLPNGTVGTPYSQTLTPAGGTAPFTWSVSTGALPTGLTLSATGSLAGTPTAAGTFNFTLQVADSAARTATASFTITVIAALTITTATLPNATVGSPYSQTLALAGGAAPFTWSIAGAPIGLSLNPSADSLTASLSGTPSTPGVFTFTVGVVGGGQSTTKPFTITVGVPPGPPATITGLPATPAPATQPALGISIGNAYPLAITGQVTLTFAPDSPSPDGQEVVFTTGGRTVSFTVPANTTQVVFSGVTPGVQIGTVSGTITLTLKLTAAGVDVTPQGLAPLTLLIAKSAPKITSATVTLTSGGFNLVVVGYATSREMVSATVTFTAATGVTLSSSQATISLATVFTTWYQSSTSAAYGSNFSLTMPFTIANGTSTNPLTSVSVMLTNAQGNSTTVSTAY